MLTLSVWLVGCGPDDDDALHTGLSGSCVGSTTQQFASEVGTHTELPGCGDSFLGEFEILGEGTFDLALYTDGERLIPNVTSRTDGGVLSGLRARGTFELEGRDPAWLWRLPYTGGGEGGVFALGDPELGADGWPVFPEGSVDPHDTSSWAALVARADGGALLVGGLSGTATRTTVGFGADGSTWFAWGGRGERWRLDAGESVFLDPLHVAIGADPSSLWSDWADRVQLAVQGAPPTTGPLVGAGTEDVDPDALTMGDAMVALDGLPDPALWVSLGPGWQAGFGDWTPNGRFPDGLAPLARAARSRGGHAAVWMAPFSLDPASPVLALHPEWAVEGATWDGRPTLDTTDPEALAWLVDQVTVRVADGFEAVELGAAGAGAVDGPRAGGVPGVAAWRAALVAVRAAVGPDVRLLVSDAPLLPSVGLVDGFRVGVGEAWPVDAQVREDRARVRGALAFVGARWWWNDPGLADSEGALSAALGAGGVLRTGSGSAGLLRPELVALTGVSTLPATWSTEPPVSLVAEAFTVLQNVGAAPLGAPGPGGTELWSGEAAVAGEERTLQPGDAEIWVRE